MHEMAEKCATAIKNECAPSKKTEKKGKYEDGEPLLFNTLCATVWGEEVRKGNYNEKITYSHLPEWAALRRVSGLSFSPYSLRVKSNLQRPSQLGVAWYPAISIDCYFSLISENVLEVGYLGWQPLLAVDSNYTANGACKPQFQPQLQLLQLFQLRLHITPTPTPTMTLPMPLPLPHSFTRTYSLGSTGCVYVVAETRRNKYVTRN